MIRSVIRVAFRALIGLFLVLGIPGVAQENASSGKGAVVRGLDKVNGQIVDVELFSGATAAVFGLDVSLADCRYPADNPTGDAFAFLTIRENGAADIRFEGWMIASAPALSALDHSRYDVWVLRCITS
ncbi:MAG: hypothetical protein ACI8R4_000417 [Paracoccaceae bacterium]